MPIIQRPYSGEADKALMSALSRQFPSDNLRVTDLPYRLSSWACDDPANVGLWFDDARLVAWAVLQTPFWTLDYAYHPDAAPDIHPHILAWADERARAALKTPTGRPTWFVNVFADQSDRRCGLEAASFVDQDNAGEDAWAKVFLRCDALPAAPGVLPDGFTIRPLTGESEVAAYVALHRAAFGTENITEPWRGRTLQRPEYTADLDLVAVTPDGHLAAFCIGWLTPDGPRRGQIEPLGVHPDFQGRGLGRDILIEGLRRLSAHGAEEIFVETDTYRNPALALYTSVGFRKVRDICVYGKNYE